MNAASVIGTVYGILGRGRIFDDTIVKTLVLFHAARAPISNFSFTCK